jgi:hypothetical protein
MTSRGTARLVFVNELENQMGFDYYTAFLVYLKGVAGPIKIDARGRFVPVDIPAGTLDVLRVGLYSMSNKDLLQYMDGVPPFSLAAQPGETVIFPYVLITKLLKAGSAGSYVPVMDTRKLAPAELAAGRAELDKAQRAGSDAVLPVRPLDAFIQPLAVPDTRPAVAFQQDSQPFLDFAKEKGIADPSRYGDGSGEFFFPRLTVSDRAARTATLGGYVPRKGRVDLDWGGQSIYQYSNGRFEPASVTHAFPAGPPVQAVKVTWVPLEGPPKQLMLFADFDSGPADAASAPVRSRLPDGETLVVMDSIVQIVTSDIDGAIRNQNLGGVPAASFVRDAFAGPFDFIFMFPVRPVNGMPPGRSFNTRNDVKGIGMSLFGAPDTARLVSEFTALPIMNSAWTLMGHEMLHAVANFVVKTSYGGHWGYSTVNGLIGGLDPATLRDLGGGRYSAAPFQENHNGGNRYSSLELYLFGMAPASEVAPVRVFDGVTSGSFTVTSRSFRATGSRTVTIADIVREQGPRVPAYQDAPRSFRGISFLLTDTELSPVELEPYVASLRYFSDQRDLPLNERWGMLNFRALTRGRGSIRFDGLQEAWRSTPKEEAHQ